MIKIFIGTEPKTEIARKVLEYSILKNTTVPSSKIEFVPMLGENWITRPGLGVGTGFSLFRWDIPKRCDYKGAAIYLDADIICLGDIKELYSIDVAFPNEGASVWCCYYEHKWYRNIKTPETSVMLIDCAKAKDNQPNMEAAIEYIKKDKKGSRSNYAKIMRAQKHKIKPQQIPDKFNRLNTPVEGKTILLHYTREPQQPWYDPKHKFAGLWQNYLVEAIEAGHVTKEEISSQCERYRPHKAGKRGEGLHPFYKKYV